MNENHFISERRHTRVKFEPLTTSCALVCLTPNSPMAQVIDPTGASPSYIPQGRNGTGGIPCVIFPDVRAFDPDDVFTHGSVNEYLSLDTIKWYVDNEEISTVWTLGTDYEIVTAANDTRGTLRVLKNLAAGETATLKFEGTFYDWRTGLSYPVTSDEKTLTCTEKGSDHTACSVDKPVVPYDPLYDNLLLWEYKNARGLATGTRAEQIDGKCYEQEVKVTLTVGETVYTTLPNDITMQLVYMGSSTPLVANSEASPEVLLVSYPSVKIDMRFITSKDYEIQFVKNNEVFERAKFNCVTQFTMPIYGKPLFGADIPVSMDWYENKAMMNLADRAVDYPEVYYAIRWQTQAMKQVTTNNVTSWVGDTPKLWQLGEMMACAVRELGIGLSKDDSYFDVNFEVTPHETDQLLTDESDDGLTDENDEMLIG